MLAIFTAVEHVCVFLNEKKKYCGARLNAFNRVEPVAKRKGEINPAWLVRPLLSQQRARSLRHSSQGPDRLPQGHCLRHVKCNSYLLPRENS